MATATDEGKPGLHAVEETDADREAIDAANALGEVGAVDDADRERSIEEMADDEPAPKPIPPMQVALPGMTAKISSSFGGAQPTASEIRLLGGKLPIDGSFEKGTELDLIVRVKVTGVLGQDATDDWGKVTTTTRRHMARMLSVRRATS